jgi:hypothetical protein
MGRGNFTMATATVTPKRTVKKAAKAKDKDGAFRRHLYLITPNKEHAKGTKQARIAAKATA